MTQNSQKKIVIAQILLAAAIFATSFLVGIVRNGGHYTTFSAGDSISEQEFGEAHLYAVGAKRWMSKGLLSDEMEIYELKNSSNPYPILHSLIVGSLGFPFKDITFVWPLAQIIISTILWLSLYRFFHYLTDNAWIKSFMAWATLLLPFIPWRLIVLGGTALNQPIAVTSLPHPALSLLVLFTAAGTTVKALCRGSRLHLWVAGIMGGLLFYTSFCDWVAFLFGLTLLAIVEQITHRKIVKATISIVLIALGTSLPGLFLWGRDYLLLQSPLLTRVGYFDRRGSLVGVCAVLAGLSVLLLPRNREDLRTSRWAILILASILAGAGLGSNLQLLTGYNAQHDIGFIFRIVFPIGVALALALTVDMTRRYHHRKWYSALLTAWLIPLLLAAGYVQFAAGAVTHRDHWVRSPRRELLKWIAENVPAQAVVGTSDPELIDLIPASTSNWNFVPAGDRTNASDDEILRRYLLECYLEDTPLVAIEQNLGRPSGRLRLHPPYVLFGLPYLSENLRKQAREFFPKIDPTVEFGERRLDYVVLPSGTGTETLQRVFAASKTLYSDAEWTVVRVDHVRMNPPPAPAQRQLSSPERGR